MTSWRDIERRLGERGLQDFAAREIEPLLRSVPVDRLKKDGKRENRLNLPMSVGFFSFVGAFLLLSAMLPDNVAGNILRFVLFPVLFIAAMIGALYIFKDRVIEALMQGRERFIARSKALAILGEKLGLIYISSPGGAPGALKFLARQRWAPAVLRDVAEVLDDHGGMDRPLEIARASGAMAGDAPVLGSKEQKAKYLAHQAPQQHIEDGFQGARSGVPFSAFEWIESDDDAPKIHHLVMVFTAPHRLYGVTQLRTRRIAWPFARSGVDLKPVGVVAPAFEDRFRIRASDQVEARTLFDPVVLERVATLAHGEKVRAVAFDNHLVIDVAGEDRFALVDLITGEWSDDSIRRTMINIAEMLELADAIAHAFKLRAAA